MTSYEEEIMTMLYISLYFTIYRVIETRIETLCPWVILLRLLNSRLNRLGHWKIIYPLLYPMQRQNLLNNVRDWTNSICPRGLILCFSFL